MKAEVRERDGQRCTQCGMTADEHRRRYRKTLDVHRRVPGSWYRVADCVTLCVICHGGKPKSPRHSFNDQTGNPRIYTIIPAEYADLLRAMTDEVGSEYEGRSVAFLTKLAVRAFLQAEGRVDAKGRPNKPPE